MLMWYQWKCRDYGAGVWYIYDDKKVPAYRNAFYCIVVWISSICGFYGMDDEEEIGLGTGDPSLVSYRPELTHLFPLLPPSSPEEAIKIHIFLRLLHAPMALSGIFSLRF